MAKMIQVGKRRREDDNSKKNTVASHSANRGRIVTRGWTELTQHLDNALMERDNLMHAVTQAVIEHEIFKETKLFEDLETNGWEEDSDESVDHNLCNTSQSKESLARCNRITRNKRKSILHMLTHHKAHIVGDKVFSPLGNQLPKEKSKWMEDDIMKNAGFTTGHQHSNGLASSQGFIDYMHANQDECLYHRALLLWYWALGEAGEISWNKPCIKYFHSDAGVQQRIMMNQARYAPSDDQGHIVTHFVCVAKGEPYNVKVKWQFGKDLCFLHENFRSYGEKTWCKIAELLETTSMEMEEIRESSYDRRTKWTMTLVNMVLSPENKGDYTALSSMIKALAETYRNMPDMRVNLTKERIEKLQIPTHLTTYDNKKKLHLVDLDFVLDYGPSWDILAETYTCKTQGKTPREVPPGVPTGRGHL